MITEKDLLKLIIDKFPYQYIHCIVSIVECFSECTDCYINYLNEEDVKELKKLLCNLGFRIKVNPIESKDNINLYTITVYYD